MGLDDRLQGAHQRRLADTRRRLANRSPHLLAVGSDPIAGNNGARRSPRLLSAAAVALLIAGSLAVAAPWADSITVQSAESEADIPAAAAQAPNPCPSGRRAPLEDATLRYVSENEGWGRLGDLVDEQDGPHYFSGWEPNYPDSVTVEVLLDQPVLAADIRVAQDPFTPVSGLIAVGVVGGGHNIELSGTGGWKVHRFEEPFSLDAFTLNRHDREANVMEVMVCLADDPGPTTTAVSPTTPPSTAPTTGPTVTGPTTTDPTTTTSGETTTTTDDGSDPHPQTPGVHDSFGEVAAPDRSAMAWTAVDGYYRQSRPGQCSQELHDRYWVRGSDGGIYPTWHPLRHPSGCSFGHSHGDDPRSSDLYRPSNGLPFGMAAEAQDSGPMRRNEDHVGHKVVREDDWGAVEGNPVNDGAQLRRTGTTCQWLSKIHQGTYSIDALGNNVHEYYLNLSCTDGTEIRVKELAFWGEPGRIFNECSGLNADRFGFTHGWIDAGISAVPDRQAPYFHDGKREFQCVPDMFYRGDGELSELWKPDGQISTPEGGSAIFSPYYIVTNPARVVDPNWRANGGGNGWVATIDFCFDDTEAWATYVAPIWDFPGMEGFRGQAPTFCADVPPSLVDVSADERWAHPDSPFDGSETAIHPKGPQIFNGGRTRNHPDGTRFCTDAFGQNPTWPTGGGLGPCGPGRLEQLLGTVDNRWGDRNINGSDVNAGPGLTAPGIGNEWVRDFGNDVDVPN